MLGRKKTVQTRTPVRAQKEKAAVGFEPTNNGFANRRLSPLGHAANSLLIRYLRYLKMFIQKLICRLMLHYTVQDCKIFEGHSYKFDSAKML